ncbi:hypothetical protein EDB87DRAFT_1632664 [Lactarius vividus]|nr:hypothetical protein EDB87DRAFT_1632664 [Lactarius vividus]
MDSLFDDDDQRMTQNILRPIRNVYIALHHDTDSARFGWPLWMSSSHPLCNVPGHHPDPDSAPHIHDNSASTTLARTALHDNAALVPASPTTAESPSSSIPAPLRVDEGPANVPPLDHFRSAHQTIIESPPTPVISPDPATRGAVQDMVNSGITMPRSTPKTSVSIPPLSSTSPSIVLSLHHNEDLPAPSDEPNLPPSASTLNIFSTESCRPIVVATIRTSAPDLGAAAQDGGGQKPGLRKDTDALDTPSMNREIRANTVPALDLPPQPSSLSSVTDSDIAIASPSMGPNAERTGRRPPHPSHGQYDIV